MVVRTSTEHFSNNNNNNNLISLKSTCFVCYTIIVFTLLITEGQITVSDNKNTCVRYSLNNTAQCCSLSET